MTIDRSPQRPQVSVLDRFRVAPATPSSLLAPDTRPPPEAILELTYFDMFFLILPPVQRLFLYRLPSEDDNNNTASHDVEGYFRDFHLPLLKSALSHALAMFYPLAGRLVKPADMDTIPFVSYKEGRDSVEFNVAESDDEFDEIVGDEPKESSRLHGFVPTLESLVTSSQEGQDTEFPVLAVQVTLFPKQRAVAVGIAVSHTVADGSSSTHFVKTWAALSRQLHANRDFDLASAAIDIDEFAAGVRRPILDRSIVHDPKGLRQIYFDDLSIAVKMMQEAIEATTSSSPAGTTQPLLRATFPLSRTDLDVLRRKTSPPSGVRYSSFTVASALAWVCTVKARGMLDESEKLFSFVPNLRSRMRPPLPAEYFGNCLGVAIAPADTADLVGDQGLAVAAAKIWKEVQDLHDGGMLIRLGEGMFKEMMKKKFPETLSVAGSPGLGVYEVDFGWGKPVKVEVVSCEKTGGMSLAETSDGRGGVEVGIPLTPEAMPEFQRLWRSALQADDT